ncbi:RING-H2 finger protein [Candidatus Cardinium hertigii]|uniref:RING-H2 finger protein n=2 Tax=Candidatus Cardinium hertigii TaxID=247481 RepID=A0A3N2QBC8_9BACT|nr:RING-H2 finger protein [Candidatus Cardinium hertigii]ROT47596.1 RING-H2 finger protein [Candidatus Cardinium hertigii]
MVGSALKYLDYSRHGAIDNGLEELVEAATYEFFDLRDAANRVKCKLRRGGDMNEQASILAGNALLELASARAEEREHKINMAAQKLNVVGTANTAGTEARGSAGEDKKPENCCLCQNDIENDFLEQKDFPLSCPHHVKFHATCFQDLRDREVESCPICRIGGNSENERNRMNRLGAETVDQWTEDDMRGFRAQFNPLSLGELRKELENELALGELYYEPLKLFVLYQIIDEKQAEMP